MRAGPIRAAARSSGRPFCTHTSAPSAASSGAAAASAPSLASVRVQSSIRSYGAPCAGNEAAAGEAKAACEKAGAARVHLVKFDVADPEACAKAVDEVIKELGGLQILVNNAGISIDGLILRYKADDLRRACASA